MNCGSVQDKLLNLDDVLWEDCEGVEMVRSWREYLEGSENNQEKGKVEGFRGM